MYISRVIFVFVFSCSIVHVYVLNPYLIANKHKHQHLLGYWSVNSTHTNNTASENENKDGTQDSYVRYCFRVCSRP